MSWGVDLWDQYENLEKHTQKGIDFFERIGHFYRERCVIECDYANKLRRLVRNHQPKKREENDILTAMNGFTGMLSEIHDLAGQHEVIAESIQNEIIKEMQTFIGVVRADRRKHLNECVRLQSLMRAQHETLERSKRKYERAFGESERAMQAHKKADADMNLSRGDLEKQRVNSIHKSQECEECKSEYANVLQHTNHYQNEHYTQHMPQTFQLLQEMDERRTTKISECIQRAADIEMRVIPIITNCITGIQKAGTSINASQDSQLIIDKYKSGFTIPEDIPFEDLSNQSSSTSNLSSNALRSTPNQNNSVSSVKGLSKTKTRRGIFGIFGGSKVDEHK